MKQDTFTPAMRNDLQLFLENYDQYCRDENAAEELMSQPFMPRFEPPPPLFIDPEAPTAKRPDSFYFAIDGQELPLEVEGPGSMVVAAMCAVCLFGGFLVLTLAFFWIFVPWLVQGMLAWAGR